MSTRLVQWTNFKGGWQDFERLCADIIEHHGYVAELRSSGGGDEGRDIDAFEVIEQFPVQKRRVAFWVECKSRLANKPRAVPLDEVSKCILYARTEGVPALVFMTNYKLSNEAKDQITRLSQLQDFGLGVSYIEEELLDHLIVESPDVYERYFSGPLSDIPSPRMSRVECILRSEPSIAGTDSNLVKLVATNFGFRRTAIDIRNGEIPLASLAVDAFSRAEVVLPNAARSDFREAHLVLVARETNVEVSLDNRIRPITEIPVLSRFFNPLGLSRKVLSRIEAAKDTYIVGPAGAGKTTLAIESAHLSGAQVISVDADQVNETTRLSELLLRRLRQILCPVTEFGADNTDWIQSGHALDDDLAQDAALGAALQLLKDNLADNIIVLDNLHRCKSSDVPTLQRLFYERPVRCLILSARTSEFQSTDVERFINRGRETDSDFVIHLDRTTISRTVLAIMDGISGNDDTRHFLRQFDTTADVQSLKLLLDTLRAKGLLTATGVRGRYALSSSPPNLDFGHYSEILRVLLASLPTTVDMAAASDSLEIAAIWGNAFPSDLIIFAKGSQGEKCLNELLRAGIVVDNGISTCDIRFGHNSTQEIVLRGISANRKIQFHRSITQFLDLLGPRNSLNVPTKRAYHLASAGELYPAAALLYAHLAEARHRLSRPQALAICIEALSLFDRCPEGDLGTPAADGEEVELLSWIVELGYLCHGPDWGVDYIRRLEFRAYTVRDPRLLGRTAYYWSRHLMYQQNDVEALSRSETAVRLLQSYPDDPYLIRALNRLGNIQKNRGQFPTSAQTHRKAAGIARQRNEKLELSQSLRELGATFLEAGRPLRTLRLWSRSLQLAEATGAVEEIVLQKLISLTSWPYPAKRRRAFLLCLKRSIASQSISDFWASRQKII